MKLSLDNKVHLTTAVRSSDLKYKKFMYKLDDCWYEYLWGENFYGHNFLCFEASWNLRLFNAFFVNLGCFLFSDFYLRLREWMVCSFAQFWLGLKKIFSPNCVRSCFLYFMMLHPMILRNNLLIRPRICISQKIGVRHKNKKRVPFCCILVGQFCIICCRIILEN